jgi:diguanylate cyclase (GGDEF)-like protein
VTVSAGVATVEPGDQERSDRLLERADRALYEAKRAGRNRVASASPPVAAG